MKRAVEGEFTVEELNITPALADHDSNEFKSLAGAIEKEVRKKLYYSYNYLEND